jgi:hypothetical protein
MAASSLSCARHGEPGSYRETDGITLDADVPGTQVFLAEKPLGTVPVTLSAKALASLGVPNPRLDTNLVFNSDGFGETVFVCQGGTEFKRFTFLVPARVRADYVPMETPWGLRTKHDGASSYPGKSFQVNCARAIRHDGLSLTLEAPHPVSDGKEPWKLKATLMNHGLRAITGFRPSLMICRSAFCPPWNRRGPSEPTLSKEWASIGPGQSLETELSLDPPDTRGDYGIYVIFSLFKDATSNYLAGDGWCYSNTKLLSVK